MKEALLLLQFATPVGLAAMGETVVQRAGVLNLGIEGAMLVGAFAGTLATVATGSPWVGLVAGVLAGWVLTLLAGAFTISLGSDQVVVGTAVSLLATGISMTVYRAIYGQSGALLSFARLPSWGGLDAVMVLGIVMAPLTGWMLWRTQWGLAVRAAGEYPKAAEAAGYSVSRLRYQALGFGGLLAGLAGAYLAVGIVGSFSETLIAGRGFVAIAMVTFGRWRPGFVFLAALLIGYLDSLQFVFQSRGIQVPYQLLIAMPYAAALLVLIVVGRGSLGPAALGQPYRRTR